MKFTLSAAQSSTVLLVLALSWTPVQGGQILSHIFPRDNDPNNHLFHQPAAGGPAEAAGGGGGSNNQPNRASHLEWNSQIGGGRGTDQLSRQGGDRGQFQPYANFALQDNNQAAQFGITSAQGCRTRDKVYLPDMQSFLINVPMTYEEAVQACLVCGSELVLVDGTNVNRFQESFSSLGLYSDKQFWIKSWFGEQVNQAGSCPAVHINALMGNRLEPVEEDCQGQLLPLCY